MAEYLEHDWYRGSVPRNVIIGKSVYIDSSYSFSQCLSRMEPAVTLGDASGVYDRTAFILGPAGHVTVGPFTCLNGTYIVCNDCITIGANCLLAWGVLITDTWVERNTPLEARRQGLRAAAHNPDRQLDAVSPPRPVVLEDNVWVGFDSVILPGVTLGHGCIIGCKTVIGSDVPPYAVAVGNPARIVRFLEPDDTEAVRQSAMNECIHRYER